MLLVLGFLAYSVIFERWNTMDSLFFTVVMFMSVAYGNIVPSRTIRQLFRLLFAVTGIAFLGIVLGVVGSRVVEAQVAVFENAKRETSQTLLALFRKRRDNLG